MKKAEIGLRLRFGLVRFFRFGATFLRRVTGLFTGFFPAAAGFFFGLGWRLSATRRGLFRPEVLMFALLKACCFVHFITRYGKCRPKRILFFPPQSIGRIGGAMLSLVAWLKLIPI